MTVPSSPPRPSLAIRRRYLAAARLRFLLVLASCWSLGPGSTCARPRDTTANTCINSPSIPTRTSSPPRAMWTPGGSAQLGGIPALDRSQPGKAARHLPDFPHGRIDRIRPGRPVDPHRKPLSGPQEQRNHRCLSGTGAQHPIPQSTVRSHQCRDHQHLDPPQLHLPEPDHPALPPRHGAVSRWVQRFLLLQRESRPVRELHLRSSLPDHSGRADPVQPGVCERVVAVPEERLHAPPRPGRQEPEAAPFQKAHPHNPSTWSGPSQVIAKCFRPTL